MKRMFPRTRDQSTNTVITGIRATTMPVPHSRGIHPSPVAMLTVAPMMSNANAANVTLLLEPCTIPAPHAASPHIATKPSRRNSFTAVTEVPGQLGRLQSARDRRRDVGPAKLRQMLDHILVRGESVRPARRTLQTIDHLDHVVSRRNSGISREFRSNFASRGLRDSSDHCSTD